MAWFNDLSPCDYFGAQYASSLTAVGWLENGKPYPVGPVDRQVYDRLVELRKELWQPMVAGGHHACNLCQFESEAKSVNNLFIPANGFILVCPELIVHYINAHRYVPPDLFCSAVLACPSMRSSDYRKAILANGGGPLAKLGRS